MQVADVDLQSDVCVEIHATLASGDIHFCLLNCISNAGLTVEDCGFNTLDTVALCPVGPAPSKNISGRGKSFIGGLNQDVTTQEPLKHYFEAHGEFTDSVVMTKVL